jgi:hypothetical protein
MAMNFNDLIGPKSRAGSIQSFVRYARVPGEVVLEEAQALIYGQLRIREMRSSALITLSLEAFTAALPTGFLEPISMQDMEGWNVIPDGYVSEDQINRKRLYDTDVTTTLSGTITAGATSLSVASAAEFSSADPFTILIGSEVMLVTAGQGTTTWTVTRGYGGTTAAAHTSGATVDGRLESGTPTNVAVFDELFQFDCKADEARTLSLVYFKTPTLLSASNSTNFLTRRYPNILRVACQAGAASFMKDAEEFSAREAELLALINAANAESDLGKAA